MVSRATVDSFEFHARHLVRETADYVFEIDEYRRNTDQLCILHFRVTRWCSSVLRQMLAEWKLFRSIVTAPLFATGQVDDAKWRRFVSLFGFVPLMDVITESGEPRLMYIHRISHGLVEPTNPITDGHAAVVGPAALS